jgi:branched-chain amino acid transport system ATP-binding protein
VLELVGIDAGYGDVTVLRDVNLTVGDGTIVALLGPNGAGKSTLLRTAAGLIRPTRGKILFNGEDVTKVDAPDRAKRGLCIVPEGRSIFPSLTVRENLVLYCGSGTEREGIARACEAFPALTSRMQQTAGTLSGGEQQMLAMVRVFTSKPSLVLIDEASLGLAPIVVDGIFEFMKRICGGGTSLLMVEQYVTRALEMSREAYLLNRGVIAFSGPSSSLQGDDIFERYLGIGVPDSGAVGRRRSGAT